MPTIISGGVGGGGGGGAGTVTSLGSADGSVVITNPTTTPDLSIRALSAATPGALAAINVNTNPSTFKTGSMAFVTAMRAGSGSAVYVLQPAVSTVPDSFFVVATADDVSRQWVYQAIQEQGALCQLSGEIDLTVSPQTVVLIPPIGYRLGQIQASQFVITAKDGTITTGPTAQIGTDAGATNLGPSVVQTTLVTAALNSVSSFVSSPGVTWNLDLTTNGLVFKITSPAVLGTATVFKARIKNFVALDKY